MSETDVISFPAIIQKEGNFIFVAIPFVPTVVWGKRPRYKVHGWINGVSVRGTLGVFGQEYFLRLSVAWVRSSGIEPGATVIVQLASEGDDT
jgi:hypothetical protein